MTLKHSITTKLLLLFLFIGISTVIFIGAYSFYSARQAIMKRTVEQLISVRSFKKQQIGNFLDYQIRNLRLLQRDTENYPGKALLLSIYGFSNIYKINGHSTPRIKSPGSESLSPEMKKILGNLTTKPVADTVIIISDLFFRSALDSTPVMLVGCSNIAADTASDAFLFAEIPAIGITRIMLHENSKSGLGNSGEAYLAGPDFLMRSESRFIPGSLLRIPVRSESAEKAIRGETGAMVTTDYRGVQVFSAYEPVEFSGLRWVILAEIDYEEAMIPVTGLRNDIMLVSLVISLLILGFAQLISKMVTQPIIRLKNAAAGLGRGEFDHKVHVKARDEIGLLADTFNAMSDQLKEERRNRLIALFDGQEMERKRISRELHDGLGQKLVGTKLHIENCDDNDPRCIQTTLTGTKSQLHAIVEELRRISNDLMPAALVELGLEAAVKNLCNDVSTQTRLDVECDITLDINPADQISVYLFRICQEGMQNIIKHAKASRVSLQLIENREMLILIIEDNGAGFNPGLSSSGHGLMNMKERSSLLGGTFTIESEPGNGTTLRVKIPKTRS